MRGTIANRVTSRVIGLPGVAMRLAAESALARNLMADRCPNPLSPTHCSPAQETHMNVKFVARPPIVDGLDSGRDVYDRQLGLPVQGEGEGNYSVVEQRGVNHYDLRILSGLREE